MPRGRSADRAERIAVIDVGSNSVRLVVFDGNGRAPLALFNEKALCGLARGLERTQRLNPQGVVAAISNLRRFVALARAMGVERIDVLATAAVRDAVDGPVFVATVERQFGVSVRILSGEEEARLSATGVLAGMPDADGIMGDLGGGSMELVSFERGEVGATVTLPVGPLRLADAAQDNERRARELVDAALDGVPWLAARPRETLYLVGGAWRALARIHMEHTRYPLHVIQGYTLAREEADDFLKLMSHLSRKSLEKIGSLSRRRMENLPLAALVLSRLLKAAMPRRVTFSAYGLREGFLLDSLDPAERRLSPLVEACRAIGARTGRFGADGDRLKSWTDAIFAADDGRHARLRHAAALLGDTAWTEHPDYRAEQAFRRAVQLPFGGIEHGERVILGAILHARYGGPGDGAVLGPFRRLIGDADIAWARAVGLAFRLAFTLTGGTPQVLDRTRLVHEEGTAVLEVRPEDAALLGETADRRLEAFARAAGLRGETRVASA